MNSWVKSIKLKVTSKYCAFVDGLEDDLQVGEVVLIYSWKSVEEVSFSTTIIVLALASELVSRYQEFLDGN